MRREAPAFIVWPHLIILKMHSLQCSTVHVPYSVTVRASLLSSVGQATPLFSQRVEF